MRDAEANMVSMQKATALPAEDGGHVSLEEYPSDEDWDGVIKSKVGPVFYSLLCTLNFS